MVLPKNYTLRPVKASDHEHYIQTLAVLTTVGQVTKEQFQQLVDHWENNSNIYHPWVITNAEDHVVATGMLLVEHKLIHGCGKVGHIEDISVTVSQQGLKLGNHLIEHLSQLAKDNGCYKVILDCSETNVGFYEKCGYKVAGVEMSKRYD